MKALKFGWLALALGAIGCAAGAQQRPAVLVELFTSEGCSSCPPADELLSRLAGKQAPNGPLIVALSEHVTYWNHDGWVDPFSQELFTQRQNGYARAFRIDGPYTPQAVVDGRRQMVGSDGTGILKAIDEDTERGGNAVRIVSVKRDGAAWTVSFEVAGQLPKEGAEVMAAVADDAVVSRVGSGENGGRTLTHVSVARSLQKVATINNAGAFTVKVPALAPAHENASGKQHLVVFVQALNLGDVLGVAAIEL